MDRGEWRRKRQPLRAGRGPRRRRAPRSGPGVAGLLQEPGPHCKGRGYVRRLTGTGATGSVTVVVVYGAFYELSQASPMAPLPRQAVSTGACPLEGEKVV